jgi:hypothetical protein
MAPWHKTSVVKTVTLTLFWGDEVGHDAVPKACGRALVSLVIFDRGVRQ